MTDLPAIKIAHFADTHLGYRAMSKLDPETAGKVVYGPEQIAKLTIPNWEVVNAKRAEWTERWNKEIERR